MTTPSSSGKPFSIEEWRAAALKSKLDITGERREGLEAGFELVAIMTARLRSRDVGDIEPILNWRCEELP